LKGLESIVGSKVEMFILDLSKRMRRMDLEFINGLMELLIGESGNIIRRMDWENTLILIIVIM
jgi:hypothetical protein